MAKRTPFHKFRGTIKTYFREWRDFKGLTQQRLADWLGTSKTRISMKENNKEGWDDAYLAALADALGVSEPASLIMRNPQDEAAPWNIVEGLSPENREKVLDFIQMVKRDEAKKTKAA